MGLKDTLQGNFTIIVFFISIVVNHLAAVEVAICIQEHVSILRLGFGVVGVDVKAVGAFGQHTQHCCYYRWHRLQHVEVRDAADAAVCAVAFVAGLLHRLQQQPRHSYSLLDVQFAAAAVAGVGADATTGRLQ